MCGTWMCEWWLPFLGCVIAGGLGYWWGRTARPSAQFLAKVTADNVSFIPSDVVKQHGVCLGLDEHLQALQSRNDELTQENQRLQSLESALQRDDKHLPDNVMFNANTLSDAELARIPDSKILRHSAYQTLYAQFAKLKQGKLNVLFADTAPTDTTPSAEVLSQAKIDTLMQENTDLQNANAAHVQTLDVLRAQITELEAAQNEVSAEHTEPQVSISEDAVRHHPLFTAMESELNEHYAREKTWQQEEATLQQTITTLRQESAEAKASSQGGQAYTSMLDQIDTPENTEVLTEALTIENRQLTQDVEMFKQKIHELNTLTEQQHAELADLSEKLTNATTTDETVRTSTLFQSLSKELDRAQADNEKMKQREADFALSERDYQRGITSLQTKVDDLKAQLKRTTAFSQASESDVLAHDVYKALARQFEAMKARATDLSVREDAKTKALKRLSDAHDALEAEVTTLRTQSESSTPDYQSLSNQFDTTKLTARIVRDHDEYKKLFESHEQLKQDTHKQQIEFDDQIKTLGERVDSLTRINESQKSELDHIADTTHAKQKLQLENETLKRQIATLHANEEKRRAAAIEQAKQKVRQEKEADMALLSATEMEQLPVLPALTTPKNDAQHSEIEKLKRENQTLKEKLSQSKAPKSQEALSVDNIRQHQTYRKLADAHQTLRRDYEELKEKATESSAKVPSAKVSSTPQSERRKSTSSEFDAESAAKILGKRVREDDLTVIAGIDIPVATMFINENITTWQALSQLSVEQCQALLDKSGARFEIYDPSTWPKQAKLAHAGKWQALKLYWQTQGNHRLH